MNSTHVAVGGVFTAVGLFTLLTPAVPFICIGALIFGPIELLYGLFAPEESPRGVGGRPATLGPGEAFPGIPREGPPVEVATDRSPGGAYARIVTRTPAVHVVLAAYEMPRATVLLDGVPYARFERKGRSKEPSDVNVPLEGSPAKVLTLRFWGRADPQIDMFLDGAPVGRV